MESPDAAERFLRFRLGRREFAIPASEIDGVSEAPRVRPVPGAPPQILGLTEWRGRILSVLDLPLLIDAAAEVKPGCLLRLAQPFQYCALYLPASVRLERDDRDPEPPTGKRSRRSPAEVTLIQVETLMRRVGVGNRVAS